ncbi:MAG TPA: HPr-rel-A system PqqD family peptide chaperone [Candidatus Competibacteraceae bacterium]|nr:HPr-rel-A system PqqD family peptide chaperone [Candidatus Competibacteraceae bacterium]
MIVIQVNVETFWQINTPYSLNLKQFDADFFILFNADSSQTHILNMLCADLLELLKDCPDNSIALSEKLAQQYEFSLDADFCIYVDKMLADLDCLGLIEPVIL